MDDVLVSIRMPQSLLSELKKLAKREHYMDLCEGIRSIVRKNWLKSLYPELMEIRRLRKDILHELKKRKEKEITRRVASELRIIRKKIRGEQLTKKGDPNHLVFP